MTARPTERAGTKKPYRLLRFDLGLEAVVRGLLLKASALFARLQRVAPHALTSPGVRGFMPRVAMTGLDSLVPKADWAPPGLPR